MKALSVKQPWAELIASGRKTIETRTWCTKHRGPLLICASKTIDNRACSHLGFVPNRMEAGFAVAIVDLVDCRPMVEADCSRAMCGLNKYAWVLENARRIEQFPVKGQLGVFEVEFVFQDEEGGGMIAILAGVGTFALYLVILVKFLLPLIKE